MPQFLDISVHFLQPLCHARGEGGVPEWPPSPLRLFQSLVAAAAARWNERARLETGYPALKWLEQLPPPSIIAPPGEASRTRYRLYVPNNLGDLVAGTWSRGGERDISEFRTEKDVQPTHIRPASDAPATVHYLFEISDDDPLLAQHLEIIASAARSVTHLGWGIDMVAGQARRVDASAVAAFSGDRWHASHGEGSLQLRTPIPGTVDALIANHERFLNRIQQDHRGNETFCPVPPLSVWKSVSYRRDTDFVRRPSRLFELRNSDGSPFAYSQARLVHIAAMTRHLACESMRRSPPPGTPPNWSEHYVAGHASVEGETHRQLSYLPLPSIGHRHADQSIRRVLIAAPIGDKRYVDHVAQHLAGERLIPEKGTTLNGDPLLIPIPRDSVANRYLAPSGRWSSITPVILPGHDDHRPAKTAKLIEKALSQSAITIPCDYEWSPYPTSSKSLTAHRYDRHRQPSGYVRPDHLQSLTAVHLTLRFAEGTQPAGPLVIGAGRHCGLGLMAHE